MLSSERQVVGRYHVWSMLHSHSPNPHFEWGATRVSRDSEMVVKAMKMNPFTVETTHVINMSTGHCVDNDVNDNLINVKEMGLQALSDPTADDQNRCPTEDLKTRMQVERSLNISWLVLGKETKLQPSGEWRKLFLVVVIRRPHSEFNRRSARRLLHFSTRAAGTKANLVKVLREDAGVSAVPIICHNRIWRQRW